MLRSTLHRSVCVPLGNVMRNLHELRRGYPDDELIKEVFKQVTECHSLVSEKCWNMVDSYVRNPHDEFPIDGAI